MDSEISTYESQILEKDLDTFGHVNNANYPVFFEEARWDGITRGGYGLKRVQQEQKGPTLLEMKIRFKKELRLRDCFRVETQMIDFEKKVYTVHQKIYRGDEFCTEAEFVMAFFDLKLRKLILPTVAWKQTMLSLGKET